jgi:hypothetical protein
LRRLDSRTLNSAAIVILSILLTGSGVAGLFLVNNLSLWERWTEQLGPQIKLGVLQPERGVVRHRSGASLRWKDLPDTRKRDVADGDSVFTGGNASARITLTTGQEVVVLPGTLLVLSSSKEAGANPPPLFEVKQGKVRVETTHAAQAPVKLLVQGKTYSLDAKSQAPAVEVGTAGIREIGDKEFKAGIVYELAHNLLAANSADVSGSNGSRGSKNVVEIDERPSLLAQAVPTPAPTKTEKVERAPAESRAIPSPPPSPLPPVEGVLPILSLWPAHDETVLLKNSRDELLPLELRCALPEASALLGEDFSGKVELKLYLDGPVKREILLPANESSISHDFKLPEGQYQWRVQLRSRKYVLTSHPRTFYLASLRAPDVIEPKDEAHLTPAGAGASPREVIVRWKPLSPAVKAEIDVIKAINVKGVSGEARIALPLGDYAWRIRSVTAEGEPSEWSPLFSFKVAPEGSKPSDVRILPTIETEEASADNSYPDQASGDSNSVSANLRWKPIPSALKYTLKIFVGQGGEKVFREVSVIEPHYIFRIESLKESAFTYQVTAHLADGRSLTSERAPIRITVLPPLLGEPNDGLVIAQSQTTVLLTWTKTCLASQYTIQVASDEDFKEIVMNELSTTNFHEFAPTVPGSYYWRVKSHSRDKESEWSAPSRFVREIY